MNTLYNAAREDFLTSDGLDWLTDDIKIVLVNTDEYVFDANHAFLSSVPLLARIKTSGMLINKSATAGVADADDVFFNEIEGDYVGAIIIFKAGLSDGSSPLIAYIDTATGIPFIPNGGETTILWSNGPNKIFKL